MRYSLGLGHDWAGGDKIPLNEQEQQIDIYISHSGAVGLPRDGETGMLA